MSSLTRLTKQQVQVLWVVMRLADMGVTASGANMLNQFSISALSTYSPEGTQGLHATAASLVRKGALAKGHTGTHTVAYSITEHGRTLLSREVEVHGRPL
jgi:hypothetical protein